VDSDVKFAVWSMSWQPPGDNRLSFKWPKWTHIWLCHS